MAIYMSAEQLIGSTPLLELSHLEAREGLSARLLAKLEFYNPGGSVKDRVALSMIRDAEERGLLTPGATILEPTSGNTGIGLACVAAIRGYRAIILMPDSMSVERQKLMKAYGAEVRLTPGRLGMQGAVEAANALLRQIPGSILAGQFTNPANPKTHFTTTGPEIWADAQGQVDVFAAGVGTGGTLTGVGEFLKSKNPRVEIVAVEPAASPLLSQGRAGKHGLQGIGANFLPEVLNTGIYDRVLPVTEEEAYRACRLLGRTEGLLVGISSGAALHAAIRLAKEPRYAGKTIVTLFPDSAERYLSTALFEE